MKVVLLGASGFSGKEVLKELLDHNHKVTAVTRNKKSIDITHDNLIVKEGDVSNPDFLKSILTNQNAVINCLGIGGKGNSQPNSFVSDTTKILIQQMETTEVKRLICMSNVGAGNSMSFQPWIFRTFILPYFMKWLKVIIEDKNVMEAAVKNSSLDWTLVRCPNILDKPAKGKITSTLDGKGLKLSITNQDLAKFMVQQLNNSTYLHEAPSVSN